MYYRRILLLVLCLFFVGLAFAGDWRQWRGPFYNGSCDEKDLVAEWTVDKNVKWVTPLPGSGSGTPAVCCGKVFISSTDDESKALLGMCFDAITGKELWRKKLSTITRSIDRDGNMAAPSPSTDGQRVYFTFEDGVIAALDFKGQQVWIRKLQTEYGSVHIGFGYSSTPLLYQGRMYVLVLRRPGTFNGKPTDSFILAIDPKTGKNIWKQPRQFEVLEETYETYSSIVPFEHDGRKELLVNGADYVTAHDPATGKEIWRYKYCLKPHKWGRNISSLVAGNGMIFGSRARGDGAFAFKAPVSGEIFEKDMAWTFKGPCPDVSTPLLYDGYMYLMDGNKKKEITCFEPETGKVKWSGKFGGGTPFRASLTAGDGKLYCISEKGEVVVIAAAGDKFKVLSRVELGEGGSRASIAIADGRLYIRTGEKLYCIGK